MILQNYRKNYEALYYQYLYYGYEKNESKTSVIKSWRGFLSRVLTSYLCPLRFSASAHIPPSSPAPGCVWSWLSWWRLESCLDSSPESKDKHWSLASLPGSNYPSSTKTCNKIIICYCYDSMCVCECLHMFFIWLKLLYLKTICFVQTPDIKMSFSRSQKKH